MLEGTFLLLCRNMGLCDNACYAFCNKIRYIVPFEYLLVIGLNYHKIIHFVNPILTLVLRSISQRFSNLAKFEMKLGLQYCCIVMMSLQTTK